MDSPVVTNARTHISPRPSPTVGQFPKMPSPRVVPTPSSPMASGRRNSANTAAPSGPVPRAPTGLAVSTGRMSGAQARDARIPAESTSDFAEFIRSTGPAGGSKSYAASKTNVPPKSPTATTDKQNAHRASMMSGRTRQQPREAAVPEGRGDNADLVDFIRQGPPTATTGHRIPRHVAPFRTTQDSDQMSGAMGGRAVDATIPDIRNSQGSTNATESSMPSMQSSVNSKSALLMGKGHQGSYNGGRMPVDDEMAMMMPKRKTRRVRDPYAIDFSDEEDFDDEMADHITEKPRIPAKEESLAEFLRNYNPPPEPVSPPESKAPKRKVSAPSLINRFTRGSKDSRDKDSGVPRTPTGSSFRGQNGAPPLSPSSPTGSKRHVPIQVNMQSSYDRYGQPLDGSRIGDIDVVSNGNSDGMRNGRPRVASSASNGARRVPMKRFEPRDAVNSRSQTADLAAFLRDSAPPPTEVARAPSRQDDSTGISRVFGRRKKMPV